MITTSENRHYKENHYNVATYKYVVYYCIVANRQSISYPTYFVLPDLIPFPHIACFIAHKNNYFACVTRE